ncbi:hypothetical protein PCO31110_02668 [Pandoraea communis]|uniref:Uncharacterized protein n=1 Tax=Pandoraea communis TaxID=2508297 RepID=A0A5E4VGR7_9BURK|nr:hypothetical protein PCO31110_02668 [Pandoraea communis]
MRSLRRIYPVTLPLLHVVLRHRQRQMTKLSLSGPNLPGRGALVGPRLRTQTLIELLVGVAANIMN